MKLNVKHLETGRFPEDKRREFSCTVDLGAVRQWGHTPYTSPGEVSGEIVSRLGMMSVAYDVKATRRDPCARCLDEVETHVDMRFSHRVEKGPPPSDNRFDDDTVFTADGVLDIGEMVISDLLLTQERVILCSPDCPELLELLP